MIGKIKGLCVYKISNKNNTMNRLKNLTRKKLKITGRNNQGRITVHHRGGGNKKLYRIIDFKRSLFNIEGIVKKIEYDPNRTAKIALINYKNGMLSYILAPNGLEQGQKIKAGIDAKIDIGNALPLENIPMGTLVHNIELKPGHGGQLMRSAGTFGKIIKKDHEKSQVIVRLHTGKVCNLSYKCMATIGVVSNEKHKNKEYKKAGEKR